MPKKELFLAALKMMNATMKQDIRDGNIWKYCNITKKKEKTFDAARKKKKFLVNCCDGVHWGCKIAGIPASALSWYGQEGGKIAWCSANAEANAKKYFDIIKVGDKTVSQLLNDDRLMEGDILTYVGFSHTNAYYMNGKSFDSGHAYCTPKSGEGAVFKKWIGNLSCKNNKVGYIFRIKDRFHYRVFAGAYYNLDKANEQVTYLERLKIKSLIREEDGMFKVQLGYFDGKEIAEKTAARANSKGVATFIREE